jgi:S1-C subfamily serine protease
MYINYLTLAKRILSIFFGCLWMYSVSAQNFPFTEEDYKKYIISQSEIYDPIMGIYLPKKYSIKSINGQTQRREIKEDNPKYAIVRNGTCFTLRAISLTTGPVTGCQIIPTSASGNYIWDPFRVHLNAQGNIEWSVEVSLDEAAKFYKATTSDLIRMNYSEQTLYEWIKIFPTEWDIKQAIKESETKKKEESPSTGTGFAISSSGLIATNFHVIEGAKKISIKGVNNDFSISYQAIVIASDAKSDLAVLQIIDSRFTGFNTLPYIFKKNPADVGESIFVLGYPLTATMGEEVKLTNGIISSKTGYEGDISMYQISAPVQPGNSGGPLFDSQGNVIGIVSAKLTQAENVGYAIKASYLQNLFDIMSTAPKLQTVNTISTKSLPEKVKVLSNFVYIILIND